MIPNSDCVSAGHAVLFETHATETKPLAPEAETKLKRDSPASQREKPAAEVSGMKTRT